MPTFSVTFETITPESAEHGDFKATGFISEGVGLREAIDDLGYGNGGVEANEYPVVCPRWITAYTTNVDYGTEMVNALYAARVYEANVTVMEVTKTLAASTLRLLA